MAWSVLKPGPDGQRRRKKVSGKNKTEVRAKLAELHDELDDGLAGRAPKTVSTQREVLEPLINIIGAVPLRELSAPTVRSAQKDLAATRATRTVGMTHAGLTRAIRHAEANDKVRRNVATLVGAPVGQERRPSKSLTSGQAVALIQAARPYGMYAYVVLSLLVGVRTEEARALRWDHVDPEGNPDAEPPVPPHVDVWRSVRAHGDTKTKRSRRSLSRDRSSSASSSRSSISSRSGTRAGCPPPADPGAASSLPRCTVPAAGAASPSLVLPVPLIAGISPDLPPCRRVPRRRVITLCSRVTHLG